MRLGTQAAFVLTMEALLDRMKGCLWGVYVGDALAMPVHWYYDTNQLRRDFGEILKYEAPKSSFPGSIMNLSNTGGGGRGSDRGSIIGDVICHGKKQFWGRSSSYHYHHGLRAGEGTLEAQLVRLQLRSMAQTEGLIDSSRFLDDYVRFMTTPNSHNDVYAGTCHRMFFANWANGKDPKKCADNDGHNVDTIDGLVPIVPTALSRVGESNKALLRKDIKDTIWVNRASRPLEKYGEVYADMILEALSGEDIPTICKRAGSKVGINVERMVAQTRGDPMTACYIDSSFPSLLYYAAKYGDNPKEALLRSTNAGGENVARGALLGAMLGASKGMQAWSGDAWMLDGLVDKHDIRREIEAFCQAVAARVPFPRAGAPDGQRVPNAEL